MAPPPDPLAWLSQGPTSPDPLAWLSQGPTSPDPLAWMTATQREEEEEVEQLPWYRDLPRRAGASAFGLAQSLGRIGQAHQILTRPGDPGIPAAGEALRNFGLLAGELSPPDQRPFLERLGDPEVSKLKTIAGAGAEAIPSLLPVAVGFALAGPPGAAAVGGLVGFQTAGLDAYDSSIAEGNDEVSSLALAGVVGSLSALLEGFGARGLAAPLKSAFGRAVAKRVARGETDTMIRQVMKGAAGEGGTEGSQELVAAAGELLAGKELAAVIETLDDRVAQAVTGGVLIGGGVGTVSLAGAGSRAASARRNELREVLEQARAMDPEALDTFIRPRQAGEWGMQALPTGEWTSEALTEGHAALDDVVVPQVLDVEKKGVRRLKPGYRGEAAMLGAEVPFLKLVRAGHGDQVADQLQNTFSYARKSTTAGRTIKDADIKNHANETVATAYKNIVSLVNPIQESPVADPDPLWLTQYSGARDRQGNAKMKGGRRVLPPHLVKSPGQRYFEETRWTTRMLDLRDQKVSLAERIDELKLSVAAAQNPTLARLLLLPEVSQAHPAGPLDPGDVPSEVTPPDPLAALGPERTPPPSAIAGTVAPSTPGQRQRFERRQESSLRARVDAVSAELGVEPAEIRSFVEGGGDLSTIENAIAKGRPGGVLAPVPAPSALDLAIEAAPAAEPAAPAAADPADAATPADVDTDALVAELAETQAAHDAINFSPKVMKDVEQRDAWLRQHPQYAILEKAAESAANWDQHMITMLGDSGIISRDQEQRILARGGHYAGFFVATPKAMPPNVRERLAKGPEEPGRLRTGLRRDEPLMLPSEASLWRATQVRQKAYAQVAKNDLLKLVEAAPDFWGQAGVSLDVVEGIHRKEIRVRAMREGKEVPIYMPKEMVQAFEQLTPVEGDIFRGAVGFYLESVANQRRVTALQTATFAIGQVLRDQPNAAIYAAEVGYRPYVEMARGILHMMTGSADYKAFRDFGGGMGSIASLDIEQSQDLLADVALRAEEADISSATRLAAARLVRFSKTYGKEVIGADPRHMFSGLFYPTARLIETLDTSTRLGAYLRALDKNYSESEALAISRRVALDFGRSGEFAGKMSRVYPFFNARAQAFSQDMEALAGAKRKAKAAGKGAAGKGWVISKTVALQAGGAALLPVFYMLVLPELIHWAARADDEDYHNERDDWEKKKYYFWGKRDDGEWLKTPRPQGILHAIFGYALGQSLDEAYRDNPRTLTNVLAVLQDEIPGAAEIPFGPGASQPFVVFEDAAQLGFKTGVFPPALEPLQIGITGRSAWQHRLVVPRWQEQRLPPRQQGYRSTPDLYRDFAKVIPGNAEEAAWMMSPIGKGVQASRLANVLTSGRVGSEGRFPTTARGSKQLTSPLWVEQQMRFLTGAVGSEVVRGLEAFKGAREGEDVPLSSLPVVRNFFARSKDSVQMWPVRRVLELAEEGKAYMDLERLPGEGMSASRKKAYSALQKRVEKGDILSLEEQQRMQELEDDYLRSRAPRGQDVMTMETYERLAYRISNKEGTGIRDLMTDWHNLNEAGDYEAMDTVDQLIIEQSIEALTEHGELRGESEIGAPGKGWAARFFKRMGKR